MFQQYIWLIDMLLDWPRATDLVAKKCNRCLLSCWNNESCRGRHQTTQLLPFWSPASNLKKPKSTFAKEEIFLKLCSAPRARKWQHPLRLGFRPPATCFPHSSSLFQCLSHQVVFPFILLSFYPCLNFLLPLLLLQTSLCSSCMARCASVSWKSTSPLFGQKICWQCCFCCRQFSMEGQLVHSPHQPHHICPAFRCDYDDHPGQVHHSVSW